MPESDKDVKQLFEDSYDEAHQAWTNYLAEAQHDLKVYLGDQWDANMKAYLAIRRRNALVFNRVRRVVKIISGYERRNRLAMKIGPVGMEDDQVSSWMTGLVMHAMSNGNGYNIISDAFEFGPLVTGLCLIEVYLDEQGIIKFKRLPYNKFLIDPSFTERDLSDAGYLTIRDWLSREQIKSLLPGKESAISGLPDTNDDVRYSLYPHSKERMAKNLLPYDQFWRKQKVRNKYLVIPEYGISTPWDRTLEDFKELRNSRPVEMRSAELENRWLYECKLGVLVNGEVLYNGADPMDLNRWPFVGLLGSYVPELDDDKLKLQGLVRCLRDPQTEYNKRISQELDIIESQMMSGWIAEQNALVSRDSIWQQGQGGAIFTKDDKIDRIKKIIPGDIPQGLAQLHQALDKLIIEIPGINEELLGSETKDIAGVLSKLRQGAGLTILQDWFDNLRLAKRDLGKLIARVIQRQYPLSQIERILNKQVTPEFRSADLMTYDCIVQEGLLTDSQRELYYEELKALFRMAAEAGQPGSIPFGAIVRAAPIQLRDELRKEIDQAEQQRQKATQEQELDKQILRKLQISEIKANLGRAEERRTEAERQDAQALLANLKAMAEVGKLDTERLEKLWAIVKDLEGRGEEPTAKPMLTTRSVPRRSAG